MKKLCHLRIVAIFLYANLMLPSALVFAAPLNLVLPKNDTDTELRIVSINHRDTTPSALFMVEQIVKRIEDSAKFVPWPRFNSGEKIYGSIKLTITIHRNGTILGIETGYSGLADGGDQALTDAAIRVVESAAPFAPIPLEYFPGSDAIRFSRTFGFIRGNQPVIK